MKPIKTLLLLNLFSFCGIIGVVSADDGGGTSSYGRYDNSEIHTAETERKTKTKSNHLRMLHTETSIHILDILRGNRYLRKLSEDNFHLFTKSGKASASTKSDKATKSSKALGSKAKGQKADEKIEDSSSLWKVDEEVIDPFDIQAKLDTCEAAATEPSWLFIQMADMCTLYHDDDGVFYLESNKFHEDTECSLIGQ